MIDRRQPRCGRRRRLDSTHPWCTRFLQKQQPKPNLPKNKSKTDIYFFLPIFVIRPSGNRCLIWPSTNASNSSGTQTESTAELCTIACPAIATSWNKQKLQHIMLQQSTKPRALAAVTRRQRDCDAATEALQYCCLVCSGLQCHSSVFPCTYASIHSCGSKRLGSHSYRAVTWHAPTEP